LLNQASAGIFAALLLHKIQPITSSPMPIRTITAAGISLVLLAIAASAAAQEKLQQHSIDTGLERLHSVAIADLNGDDRPDVLAAASNDDLITWYANQGEGRFGERF
jgi:hypothetical protein